MGSRLMLLLLIDDAIVDLCIFMSHGVRSANGRSNHPKYGPVAICNIFLRAAVTVVSFLWLFLWLL